MIDKGKVKVLGTPDEVANQYSLDNVVQAGAEVLDAAKNESDRQLSSVENVNVRLLSSEILTGENRTVDFEVSYDVMQDITTYLAFSLTDIDRSFWMYNDNSQEQMLKGTGHKTMRYRCELKGINSCKLALTVSVRDDAQRPLAFNRPDNSPVIIVSPDETLNSSRRDAASGVLTANGIWEVG